MGKPSPKQRVQWSGLFLGFIFAVGTLLRIFQLVHQYKYSILSSIADTNTLVVLVATIGLFLSAFLKPMLWFQPIIMIALVPPALSDNAESFFGLGFFVMGVLLLFRLGFYERYRLPKLIASIIYLYFWEIWNALRAGRVLLEAFMPVFFVTAFLLMLYFAFSEKLMVYLKEPKQKLSLREKTLSEAERAYVMVLLKGGKNSKEIAFDFEVSESTVRNTLARAYKKLDISDHMGLINLANQYDIID